MPLPIILGIASLATAAYGAKKGYDGYQKHSEADDIVERAQYRYDNKKSVFDDQEKETALCLEMLGKEELQIGKNIGEFKVLADELLQQLNIGRQNKLEINIPQHELQKIESYSYTATGVLGTVAGAGAAGAAAGFAVYGGVMALGAASTGTAISSLAGAAATNATLAALGGGSLATGGLGMAGGTAILGAAVAAPVLAIAGWAYDSHGDEALRNARKVSNEANEAIEKLDRAINQLNRTSQYVQSINDTLSKIYGQFNEYFDILKHIDRLVSNRDEAEAEIAKLSGELLQTINNGFALASILVNVITTPIFKLKKINGEIMKDAKGIPVMEKDADDSMILNTEELDKALISAESDAEKLEIA
jgi:hypothetical protein